MKRLWTAAVFVVMGGLVSAALAQPEPGPPKPAPIHGKIVSVGADGKITLQPMHPADAPQVVVATDGDTKVTLDGNDAKVSDLKAGMFVRKVVGDKDQPAKEVVAMSKPPQRHDGDASPPPPADK